MREREKSGLTNEWIWEGGGNDWLCCKKYLLKHVISAECDTE